MGGQGRAADRSRARDGEGVYRTTIEICADLSRNYGVCTTRYRNGSSMFRYMCGAFGGMITTSPLPTRCDSPPPINWPPSGVSLAPRAVEAVPGVINVAEPLVITTTPVQSSCECNVPSSALPRLLE